VIPRLQKINPSFADAVDEPVFLSEPARPASSEYLLQRLWLSNSCKGIAQGAFGELEGAKYNLPVGFNPVTSEDARTVYVKIGIEKIVSGGGHHANKFFCATLENRTPATFAVPTNHRSSRSTYVFRHLVARLRRCYPRLVITSPQSSVPEILMRRIASLKIRTLLIQACSQKSRAIFALGLFLAAPLYAHHLKKGESTTLPVTTAYPKARELYEKGMVDYENLYLERCNEEWRAAVKEDPNLAVAWAWIAFNSGNPQEVSAARAKAKALAPKETPGEQLMIAWVSKVQEGDFLGGITAMNDMLEMYPNDKHLFYLAGNWLMGENGDDQARRMMEKALAIDKNFPAALNDLAYVDARNRKFANAFAAMDRYVALLPQQPNPQDSYGELLRMAGNFEGSLTHYRAALKIDPDFVTSQLGLGDTYALMGNQQQARIEYDKAIRFAHNEADRLTYSMQKAMTFVRDGNYAEADKNLLEIAETAHAKEQDLQEAQALRQMAEYQSDDNVALKHLKLAEESLSHRSTLSTSDRNEEMSRILRNRAVRAARAGDQPLADKSLQQLEGMASGSRNRVIQSSYNGAAGTMLMDQKKYQDAIADLEEDQDNPFTLELLVQAYYQTAQTDKLHEAEAKLRGTNVPTLEQALVVPAVRAKRPII
jgi:tetratricopeptide (TPR) repeat protein